MELLWAAKLFQNPAKCRFYQFHEKHGDDLAGRRHHYHVPVHVDGRDFDQWHPRRKKFFKAAIYMPNIISAVALATMWIQYVFNYDYGLLNQIVKAFGGENVRWLGTDLIFWAMMIAFIFGSVGYYMLIFISGIEGIPQDLYEAATIDGANILDRFFQITLPLLKGVIRTCVTFWSINATTFFLWTKMFSPINTETATIVPVVYLYDTVFGGKGVVERDAGAGAAVGVVLTLIIIAVYVITNLILKDSDLEY